MDICPKIYKDIFLRCEKEMIHYNSFYRSVLKMAILWSDWLLEQTYNLILTALIPHKLL